MIPAYWLSRPAFTFDPATRAAFEHLYTTVIGPGTGETIAYTLAAPKWQFLAYLAEHYALALHGSGQSDIALFEPREATDANAFGNQRAVYAATDGIWPMFFAIVDRDRYHLTLVNGCVQFALGDDRLSERYYYFSVSRRPRVQPSWRDGVIYLLPGDSFVRQEPMKAGGVVVHIAQSASFAPVKPLAKLLVRPSDFPFLAQIRTHDDEVLASRAAANPAGFPWLDTDT